MIRSVVLFCVLLASAAAGVLRNTAYLGAVSVGTNGSEFLVAWRRLNELELQRVGLDGSLVGAMAAQAQAGEDIRTTAVASDGVGWEIAWAEYEGSTQVEYTRCVHFRPPYTFSAGPQILTSSSYPTFPDVAAAGPDGGYFVVWHTFPAAQYSGQVLGKQLRSDGIQTGGTLDLAQVTNALGFPSISFNEAKGAWDVAYNGRNGPLEYVSVLAEDGGTTAPISLSSGYASALPAIASVADGGSVVAWSDNYGRPFASDIRHGFISGNCLEPDGGRLTVQGGNNQTHPAIAYGDGRFMVVWEDDRSGVRQIYSRLFDAQGNPLGSPEIVAAGNENQILPAVAYDGTAFVVAWVEYAAVERLMVTRIRADYTVLTPPFATSTAIGAFLRRPSIAVSTEKTYVVWSMWTAVSGQDLFAVRIEFDGDVLDPPDQLLFRDAAYQEYPHAVANGAGICVTYAQTQPSSEIRSLCFAPTLSPLGAPTNVSSQNFPLSPVGVAADGVRFALWSGLSAREGVNAARIDAAADAGPQFTLVDYSESEELRERQIQPAAAPFYGSRFAVAYEHVTAAGGTDVRMRRFEADGGTVDTVELGVTQQEERWPAIAQAGSGRIGAVWSRYDPGERALRVMMRVFAEVPAGGRCFVDSDCQSDVCGPSICCASAAECPDAGEPADAGHPADAGPELDGGDASTDAGVTRERGDYDVSCGCSAGVSPLLLLAAFCSAVARRRR